MTIKGFLFLSIIGLLFAGCTPPPLLNMEEVTSQLEFFAKDTVAFTSFTGSGDLTISHARERTSGEADVKWDSGGHFSVNIYSPFGGRVASIKADSTEGDIQVEKGDYHFLMDETMHALPFAWGRYLTFREFTSYLLGRMPPESAILETPPQELHHDKSTAYAEWKSDSVQVAAHVGRLSGMLERIVFTYPHENGAFSVQFSQFSNALAREIIIGGDSRNYISINYEMVLVK